MKGRERGDTSGWFGLPRWVVLFIAAGVIVGAGFLLWLTAQTFNRSSTLDAQRVRALDIAADYIIKWPQVARTIAQTSLYHRTKSFGGKDPDTGDTYFAHLYHPEFGDFTIEYDRVQDKCPLATVNIYSNRLTVTGEALKALDKNMPEPERTYIGAARTASWIPLRSDRDAVCFKIANLDLGKVAPPLGSFSHLLLIQDIAGTPQKPDDKSKITAAAGSGGSDKNAATASVSVGDKSAPSEGQANWRNGHVVAWVGRSELPIRSMSDLPALQSEVSDVIAAAEAATSSATNQSAAQPHKTGATDALEPFNSRVAGKSYRFYWRPIVLDLPGNGDAGQQPLTYYLVGAAPTGVALDPGKSRTEVLAFGLVLFMLIALVPVVKLALLGPVDSMKAIEVTALCIGIVAAAAIGTAFWIGVRDVLVARTDASTKLAGATIQLVGKIETDLTNALFSREIGDLSRDFGQHGAAGLVASFPSDKQTKAQSHIVTIENIVLLDDNGRQALGTVINAARDNVGANLELGDRNYFKRALDEDFAPQSEQLVSRLRASGRGPCNIWNEIENGLVFDQIRSRTDGAPKTIVAGKLNNAASNDRCGTRTAQGSKDERLQPSALVVAFVMPSMVSPPLKSGIRYAVVDLQRDGRPVLFHSDSYRANVELFDESLSNRTRAKLSGALGDPAGCNDAPIQIKRFDGIYEGEETLFAAARVPCTDWAVVTFKSRRLVDSKAVKPAVEAIVVWGSLTIIPYIAWIIISLGWTDHAWAWMWPNPVRRMKEAYRYLAYALAGAILLSILLLALAPPVFGLLLSALVAVAALLCLAWVHYRPRVEAFLSKVRSPDHVGDWPEWLWKQPRIKQFLRKLPDKAFGLKWLGWEHSPQAESDSNIPLDHATESRFRLFVVTLLIAISVVPIAALAADARAYFVQVSAADDSTAFHEGHCSQLRSWKAIARMEGVPSGHKCASAKGGSEGALPFNITDSLRNGAGYGDKLKTVPPQPMHWLGLPKLKFIDGSTLFFLGLLIAAIVVLAIWVSTRGLFGFGVALEAVEYPKLMVKPDGKDGWLLADDLPPRFLVIRPDEKRLKALERDAFQIDLNDDIRTERGLRLPRSNPQKPKLVLIENLGLLLGDPVSRRKALERLELILAKQFSKRGERPNFRVAILTSLTPLERLLQSFERERDESDHLDEAQQSLARLERAKYREDMRWSAVFEEFTTYYHAARPRPRPAELADKSDSVKLIWEELEYIPDSAVAAMIWDPGPPVLDREILDWAVKITKDNPEPPAVIDYLASNLIEHYHLMWSLSSREERLLLYRIAHGHVPNIERAYALRSLVKRGLVVLDPYPRTMNRSFAQFVMHVEKPETIKKWRLTQEHGFWEGARTLLGLIMIVALGVLILAAIRNGDSIGFVIPFIIGAGPAILHAITSAKRTSAA